MATSQKWLMLAATLAVLFIGTANAWQHQCPPGFKACDPHKPWDCNTCVKNDVNNCGDCYKKCKALPYTSAKCNWGQCQYTCSPGWADCDHNLWKNGCETDINNDYKNCGRCGNCCKQYPYATTKCSGGQCKTQCNPGWADCDHNMNNGCEKDVSNDVYNCGGCGIKCQCHLLNGEAYCSNGKCYERCKRGWWYDNNKKCCVPGHKY